MGGGRIMDPFALIKWQIRWTRFWWNLWTRWIPPKVLLALTGLSAFIIICVIACTGG